MTSRQDLKQKLEALDSKYGVKMSQISSFTTCVNELPSDKTIRADFPDLSVLTPSVFGPMANGKVSPTMAYNTNLAFPYPTDEHPEYDDFFKRSQSINHQFMFVAFNCAERNLADGEKLGPEWSMFHDLRRPANTYNMYLEINQDQFKNCYITDALKNVVESTAATIDKQFYATTSTDGSLLTLSDDVIAKKYKRNDFENVGQDDEQVAKLIKKNREAYKLSTQLFVEECLLVKPNHLIAFGGHTDGILKKMAADIRANSADVVKAFDAESIKYVLGLLDDVTEFDHYSKTKSTKNLMNDAAAYWSKLPKTAVYEEA